MGKGYSVPHPYENVRSKIKWANKHIDDFRAASNAFMKTNPYGILVESDPNTRKRIYTVTKVTPIPPEISLIAGDAIQNLRSALDYLACGLVRVTKTEPSPQVCFPISESEPLTEKQQARFEGQVKGMRQDAINAIKGTKPYKGGDDTLWRLHRLNIIDKHRLLMAAGTSVSRINPNFHSGLREYLIKGGVPPEPTTLMRDYFPLKTGDKISFNPGEGNMYGDDQFALEIAFNEPEIAEGEVILSVLKQSRRLVQQIASSLMTFMY
jgi:hypothetical protein